MQKSLTLLFFSLLCR